MKNEHNAKKLRGYFEDSWASEYLTFVAMLGSGGLIRRHSGIKLDTWNLLCDKDGTTSLTESGLFSSI